MNGILYGIGVGPGDPELMTLKAARILKDCDVLGIPGSNLSSCHAYQIAKTVLPELAGKEFVFLHTPMTKDAKKLQEAYEHNAQMLLFHLEKGKKTAVLTIGDPAVYSSFIYLADRIRPYGYPIQMISGIPSFCAAACTLQESLGERNIPIHILPGSYPLQELAALPGTKVIMKSGSKLPEVKDVLTKTGHKLQMVEKCGYPDEKLYRDVSEIPDNAGYLSLLIAKTEDASDKQP